MNATAAGVALSRAHGRDALPPDGRDWSAGRVPVDERDRLAASLGALLRAERVKAGHSTRGLARAVGCARSTIQRLENGKIRPREGLLRAIAAAFNPDRPKPLGNRLCKAAGASLRHDTPGTLRQRRKRGQDAILAGARPLPRKIARAFELHRQADAAHRRALQLLNGTLHSVENLVEAQRLLDESKRLSAEAGPAVILRLGKHEIRAGWGL